MNSGKYRWRMRRLLPHKTSVGSIAYTNGDTYWASLQDVQSSETVVQGMPTMTTNVIIAIHNWITVAPSDRFVDTATNDLYHVLGVKKDFTKNETVILADRISFGVQEAVVLQQKLTPSGGIHLH